MTDIDAMTSRLLDLLRLPANAYPGLVTDLLVHDGMQWRSCGTPEEVADTLLQNAEFLSLRLADWTRSPDGEFVAALANRLLPPPYREVALLLERGLTLAAESQHTLGRRRAGAVALGVLVVAAGLVVWNPSGT